MTIMAFDLGKFNSVMFLYHTNTQEMAIETVKSQYLHGDCRNTQAVGYFEPSNSGTLEEM